MANLISRAVKKVKREFKRVQKQILGEVKRPGTLARTILSPELPVPDPLPIPDPPIVQGQPGTAAAAPKRKLIKAGRGGTILTGQLAPTKVGKKRLLG